MMPTLLKKRKGIKFPEATGGGKLIVGLHDLVLELVQEARKAARDEALEEAARQVRFYGDEHIVVKILKLKSIK